MCHRGRRDGAVKSWLESYQLCFATGKKAGGFPPFWFEGYKRKDFRPGLLLVLQAGGAAGGGSGARHGALLCSSVAGITESQNHQGWKKPPGSPGPTIPLPPVSPTNHVPTNHVQPLLEGEVALFGHSWHIKVLERRRRTKALPIMVFISNHDWFFYTFADWQHIYFWAAGLQREIE